MIRTLVRDLKALREIRELVQELPVSLEELRYLISSAIAAAYPDRSAWRLRLDGYSAIANHAINTAAHRNLDGEKLSRVINRKALDEVVDGGCIVCSIHMGPYQLAPQALLDRPIKLQTFAGGAFRRNLSRIWMRMASGSPLTLEVLSPEQPRDTVRAIRSLKDGGWLMLFTDTTNQTGSAHNPDHYTDVDLLNMPMQVRNGAAQLSWRSGAHMIYAAVWRTWWGGRVLKFSDPVPPVESRKGVDERVRHMYRWFDAELKKHPMQWDGWGRHVKLWKDLGETVTIGREAWDTEAARILRGMQASTRARLKVEKDRVAALPLKTGYLLFDGPGRRVLKAETATGRVMIASRDGTRLREIPGLLDLSPEVVAREAARLSLSGLARLIS